MVDFSKSFQFFVLRISQSYNPGIAVTIPVWAPSISLAATLEIDVSFFSSSYLDVSVQRVSPHCWVTGLLPAGLSHSDIRGSILVCKSPRLFAAYQTISDVEARKRGEQTGLDTLVVHAVNDEFHSCERTPQAEYLMR